MHMAADSLFRTGPNIPTKLNTVSYPNADISEQAELQALSLEHDKLVTNIDVFKCKCKSRITQTQ